MENVAPGRNQLNSRTKTSLPSDKLGEAGISAGEDENLHNQTQILRKIYMSALGRFSLGVGPVEHHSHSPAVKSDDCDHNEIWIASGLHYNQQCGSFGYNRK